MGRLAPLMRTRTYWFGRSRPCGFGTEIRTRNVPVCGLNDGSVNVMRPVNGNSVPSTITISASNACACGSLSSPVCCSRRMRAISFSETLKFTHIGESTATVVSCEFCALT